MVSHAEAKCRHNINQSGGEGEKEREKGSKEGGGRKGSDERVLLEHSGIELFMGS